MMQRTRGLLLASLLALLFVSGCGGEQSGGEQGGGEETITVATELAFPPFGAERGGKAVGFDVDLIRAVAERANYEVDIKNVTFDGIIPGLGNNQYDAAIAAMTITPEREEQIDFSEPYFNADQSLLVRRDTNIRTVDDVGGIVGVQLGSSGAIEAKQLKGDGTLDGEVRTFDAIPDAYSALENGQLEAVINDLPVNQDRANESDGSLEVVQTIPTGEQYGIAFPRDSELVEPFNRALQEVKDDGTYAEIYEKHIGRKPEQIP